MILCFWKRHLQLFAYPFISFSTLNQSTIYSALNVILVRKISHLLFFKWAVTSTCSATGLVHVMTGCGARKESCPTNGTNPLTPSGKLHSRQRWEARGECYGCRVCKFTTACVSNAQQTSSTLPFIRYRTEHNMWINSEPLHSRVLLFFFLSRTSLGCECLNLLFHILNIHT